MNLRDDLRLIYDWIPEGGRVLNLGYGDSGLLATLVAHGNCAGYGIGIDTDNVIAIMTRGVNVTQTDLEGDLAAFDNRSFDVIALSQTIQAMRNTGKILRCLVRVAKQAIVNFPSFGYWRNRFQIATGGHTPVSERIPYHWYDTPNIHWRTLKDFDLLCAKDKIRVLERAVMTSNRQVRHLPNLLDSLTLYRVG